MLLLCLTLAAPTFADVIPTPRDPATIEALISLHKLIKGEEDKALAKVTTSFGEESRYYGEIVSLTAGIFKDVPIVLKQLGKSPGKNYVVCLNEMTNLVSETEGLVHDFVDIVNNGKIRNPLGTAKEDGKDDGYNLLNRYERLTMANKIYSRLLEIHYKLEVMVMMCQFGNSWGDVLMAIDVESWAAYITARNSVDGLIDNWNGLGV